MRRFLALFLGLLASVALEVSASGDMVLSESSVVPNGHYKGKKYYFARGTARAEALVHNNMMKFRMTGNFLFRKFTISDFTTTFAIGDDGAIVFPHSVQAASGECRVELRVDACDGSLKAFTDVDGIGPVVVAMKFPATTTPNPQDTTTSGPTTEAPPSPPTTASPPASAAPAPTTAESGRPEFGVTEPPMGGGLISGEYRGKKYFSGRGVGHVVALIDGDHVEFDMKVSLLYRKFTVAKFRGSFDVGLDGVMSFPQGKTNLDGEHVVSLQVEHASGCIIASTAVDFLGPIEMRLCLPVTTTTTQAPAPACGLSLGVYRAKKYYFARGTLRAEATVTEEYMSVAMTGAFVFHKSVIANFRSRYAVEEGGRVTFLDDVKDCRVVVTEGCGTITIAADIDLLGEVELTLSWTDEEPTEGAEEEPDSEEDLLTP